MFQDSVLVMGIISQRHFNAIMSKSIKIKNNFIPSPETGLKKKNTSLPHVFPQISCYSKNVQMPQTQQLHISIQHGICN